MSEHPLLNETRNFLHRYKLITQGEKIVVAASGGLDSIVLLELLSQLSHELRLELAVGHFNHQLRGKESDEDEAFVRRIAVETGIECYVESADTAEISGTTRCSIQEAARNLRYDFFKKLRMSLGFQKVATAHNANDNAETMLFNFFRGAGIHGLSGIPAYRKDIAVIRPLLFATRNEIASYA